MNKNYFLIYYILFYYLFQLILYSLNQSGLNRRNVSLISFVGKSWPRGRQGLLYKYALLISSWTLEWKDKTFSHNLEFKRRLFKLIQIYLEDESRSTSDFLIKIFIRSTSKRIKDKL